MPGLTWLQANCALGHPGDAGVHDVVRPLLECRRQEVAGVRLRQVHFARKAPGVRLRLGFATEADEGATTRLREAAGRLLAPGTTSGDVRGWYASAYEPERYKYGGPATTDDVNCYLAADTVGWSRRIELERDGAARIDVRLLSACIVNHLLMTLLDGLDELWEVWCAVTVRHGDAPAPLGTRGEVAVLQDLAPVASPREQSLLRFYARANRRLAARLIQHLEAGDLLFGFREIMPHLVMNHWNRYGFSLSMRQDICRRMMAAFGVT